MREVQNCSHIGGVRNADDRGGPAAAQVDQWSYWQAIHLGPAMQRVAFERVQKSAFERGDPDESTIASEVKSLPGLLETLDKQLEGKDWIAGTLNVADFALATTFPLRKQAQMGVEGFANVAAWIDRPEARGSWQAAIAPWKALMSRVGVAGLD